MSGDLTIHGVTKPATFDVEVGDSQGSLGKIKKPDSQQPPKLAAKICSYLNKALETGVWCGREVAITLEVEGNLKEKLAKDIKLWR